MWRVLTALALLTVAQTVVAGDDGPSTGFVHNTKEASSLTYDCDKKGELLECVFNQTAVRMKAKSEDLPKKLQEAREFFRTNKEDGLVETCADIKLALDIFEGRSTAPKPEVFQKLAPVQKRRFLEVARATAGFCDKPTEENYLRIAKARHAMEANTCRVSSNTWRQTFRQAADSTNTPKAWIAQPVSQGICGSVDLSRFEFEKLGKLTLWKFISRKAITNPQASLLGASCKDFDEAAYVWQLHSVNHGTTCEFVEFSPL